MTSNAAIPIPGANLNELRGKRLLLWYWLGIIAALLVIESPIFADSLPAAMPLETRMILLVIGVLTHALAATFAVALAIRLRQIHGRSVRFRGPLIPLLCGFLGSMLAFFGTSTFYSSFVVTLLFSFVAGLCLCGRPQPNEQPCPAVRRRFGRYMFITGATIALLAAAGYLSALVSRRACEQILARRVAVEILRNKPFRLSWGHAQDAERIFREGGYSALMPTTAPTDFAAGNVGNTHIEFPFMVAVDYDWMEAHSKNGGGATVRFLCLFGWVIEIGDKSDWWRLFPLPAIFSFHEPPPALPGAHFTAGAIARTPDF